MSNVETAAGWCFALPSGELFRVHPDPNPFKPV
jgi:hypothetical protein